MLDCHYKRSRAVEEGPVQASAPLPTLPAKKSVPTLHNVAPPAEGGRGSASGSDDAPAPAEGGGEGAGDRPADDEHADEEMEPPDMLAEAGVHSWKEFYKAVGAQEEAERARRPAAAGAP
eukprot:10683898-Alexandrium_andersonii.AAC.1